MFSEFVATSVFGDEMPEPVPDSADSLICEEVMEESPGGTMCSTSLRSSSSGNPRFVLPDDGELILDPRALPQKLREQRLWMNVEAWGPALDQRKTQWRRIFAVYLERKLSLSSLQMGISLVDRFMTQSAGYGSQLGPKSLRMIFDAAVAIIEQLVDDAPSDTLGWFLVQDGNLTKKQKDIHVAIELILEMTSWDVIDWAPSCFVPHFIEEAELNQIGGNRLHDDVLALTTLLMIDTHIATYCCPSVIAGFGVILQTWMMLNDKFPSWASLTVDDDCLFADSIFIRALQAVVQAGNLSAHHFLEICDFMVECLVQSRGLESFTREVANQFVIAIRIRLNLYVESP